MLIEADALTTTLRHRHTYVYVITHHTCGQLNVTYLLVRERLALATIIVSRMILAFCLSAVSLKCIFSGNSCRNWMKF